MAGEPDVDVPRTYSRRSGTEWLSTPVPYARRRYPDRDRSKFYSPASCFVSARSAPQGRPARRSEGPSGGSRFARRTDSISPQHLGFPIVHRQHRSPRLMHLCQIQEIEHCGPCEAPDAAHLHWYLRVPRRTFPSLLLSSNRVRSVPHPEQSVSPGDPAQKPSRFRPAFTGEFRAPGRATVQL